nr:metalloregulator ArsR/SmtB family transcription factor [Pseudovibrio sp. M1P-2-3]
MQVDEVAKALKELGHVTRLNIFRRLVRAGFQGMSVGVLQSELEIPGSTLSHHLSAMVSAGLVKQRREGRTLYCVAQFEQLDALVSFLQEECCLDNNV